MLLVREVCGFDKETGEFVWSAPIDETPVRVLADYLDSEDEDDLVFVYDLTGDVLEQAARLVGFEIRPDLDYQLTAHSPE
ncbi:hypothetical protein F4561_000107 [Lipingzhangella halophila]|uniref:DUF7683 domain-containing protein n=1 Tax=Lipingzhangella halophila TaxID=1783352 RepID=A0A7W7RC67_9ACTN|nr:hypothetical protein [Lipingzhangella halophila]MBB4929287.1 hypothetical protein [Lipingzhangella halophila]